MLTGFSLLCKQELFLIRWAHSIDVLSSGASPAWGVAGFAPRIHAFEKRYNYMF